MRNMSISKLFEASMKKQRSENDVSLDDGTVPVERTLPALDEEMKPEEDIEDMEVEEREEIIYRQDTPMEAEPPAETKVLTENV